MLGLIGSSSTGARTNARTLALLEITPTDRVFEIGSGPGLGLREAARRAPDGHVTGLDVSSAMIAMAQRTNRRAVRAGRVELSLLDDV
jgi:cyclopropane fatty-acyl-phospholipid synthase-like methyltransferase